MRFLPGDKIRRPGPLGAWHVGIYEGQDVWGRECVIHNEKDGYVKEAQLSDFSAGYPVSLAARTARTWYEQQQVVARARSLLGQRFDPLNFNCDHLATYAQTGVAYSPQLRLVGGVAALLALVLLATAGSSA